MHFYCYVYSVLCILFYGVVLRIVCVQMCTVLLPSGVNPIAVNEIHHIMNAQPLHPWFDHSSGVIFGME
jgi:hypothetical protein